MSTPSPRYYCTGDLSLSPEHFIPSLPSPAGGITVPTCSPPNGVAADTPSPPRRALLGQHYTETHYSADGSEITEKPDTQVGAGSGGEQPSQPCGAAPTPLTSLSAGSLLLPGQRAGTPRLGSKHQHLQRAQVGPGSLESCFGWGQHPASAHTAVSQGDKAPVSQSDPAPGVLME